MNMQVFWLLALSLLCLTAWLIARTAVDRRRSAPVDETAGARPKRHLEVAKPVPTDCSTCANFDLDEGQAILKLHPAFLKAAEHVSPAMMSNRAEFTDRGVLMFDQTGPLPTLDPQLVKGTPAPPPECTCGLRDLKALPSSHAPRCPLSNQAQAPDPSKRTPAKTRWDQFGACNVHNELRWQHDFCERYALRNE